MLSEEIKIVWLVDRASVPYLLEVSMLLPARNGEPQLALSGPSWDLLAYSELRADAMPDSNGRYSRRLWFRPVETSYDFRSFEPNAVNARFIVPATASLRLARIDWYARNIPGADIPL